MKKIVLLILFATLGSCKLTNSQKLPFYFKAFVPIQPIITSISTTSGVA